MSLLPSNYSLSTIIRHKHLSLSSFYHPIATHSVLPLWMARVWVFKMVAVVASPILHKFYGTGLVQSLSSSLIF